MPGYNIEVENLDPNCSNDSYTESVIANSCTEYLVRLDPSSTTKGPFNIYLDSVLVYSNVTRNQLINGYFLSLNCTSTPAFLFYASTYDLNNNLDTIYYETTSPFRKWGVGNGNIPDYSNTGWETFINRRLSNNDRIVNLTVQSGITNVTSLGQQIKLSFPSGNGNTSAMILFPSTYGYISDSGLQEVGNGANVQGLKPGNSNRQQITLSGTQYYVAQITNYQGSEGQVQEWQVNSNEI